ncbi:type IV secretion system protein [Cysteiniphilum sp. 6C5]|uniref:type IV secretion system protein n=1 Tax=unclassified Cysteiniphilum TaxID=2610889 RepID=UPI003F8361C4
MADVRILNMINHEFLMGFQQSMHEIFLAGNNLAYWLAYITISFMTLLMLLQGEEVNKMLSKLTQMAILFGMFFTLIEVCGSWVPAWINGFMQTGAKAGNLSGIDPSSVFDQGFYIASSIFQVSLKMGIMHLPTAILSVAAGIFIIIIYAFISASLCVLLIKTYALVAVGPIIFAFGMNDVTRPTVNNYIGKLIGLGLQIMTMYIVVGVGVKVSQDWVNVLQASADKGIFSYSDILIVVGGLVIFYLVVQNVPSFIAEISGAGSFRDYGQAAVAAAMSAAAMTASAVKGVATLPTKAAGAAAALGTSGHHALNALKGAGNMLSGGYHGAKSMPTDMKTGFKGTADAFKQADKSGVIKGSVAAAKYAGGMTKAAARPLTNPLGGATKNIRTAAWNHINHGPNKK